MVWKARDAMAIGKCESEKVLFCMRRMKVGRGEMQSRKGGISQ